MVELVVAGPDLTSNAAPLPMARIVSAVEAVQAGSMQAAACRLYGPKDYGAFGRASLEIEEFPKSDRFFAKRIAGAICIQYGSSVSRNGKGCVP